MDDFNLNVLRKELIAKRLKVGSDSPLGHRYSNLLQQYETYTKNKNINLKEFIEASKIEIYKLENPTKDIPKKHRWWSFTVGQ